MRDAIVYDIRWLYFETVDTNTGRKLMPLHNGFNTLLEQEVRAIKTEKGAKVVTRNDTYIKKEQLLSTIIEADGPAN